MKDLNISEKFALVREQFAEENGTKHVMLHMLDLHGLDEDDIPENTDIEEPLRDLVTAPTALLATVKALQLDWLKCGDYLCFKVDDLDGTAEVYFVSETDVLYFEGACLSY